MNILYYGDNLDILRDKIESNSIDLIYLDPPFKSGKTYNIIFKPERGATAQIETFEDTWHWGPEAEKEYRGLIEGTLTRERPNQKLIDLIKALRSYLGECSMMSYLCMMAPRLLEMRRVLSDEGSIYLHCDPTASHYLKLLMDAIFGVDNFRNEIIWRIGWVSGFKTKKKGWIRNHDIILFYTKSDNYIFNKQYISYPPGYKRRGSGEPKGPGIPIEDTWNCHYADKLDSIMIMSFSKEKIGYPTQKPEKLLERIIKASSNEDSWVMDPFCGCGTTIAVAEKLHRKWIGIDITYLAINIISERLKKSGIKENVHFKIEGDPKDPYSAEKLAEKSPFQFQIWAITKLSGIPSQTQSSDKGIDGIINFFDPNKENKAGKGIISVKGTKTVSPAMVRELKGTIKSQNADFGILVILKSPTRGMINEAIKEGFFDYMGKKIPKISIISINDLFDKEKKAILPGNILPGFKKPIISKEKQNELPFK